MPKVDSGGLHCSTVVSEAGSLPGPGVCCLARLAGLASPQIFLSVLPSTGVQARAVVRGFDSDSGAGDATSVPHAMEQALSHRAISPALMFSFLISRNIFYCQGRLKSLEQRIKLKSSEIGPRGAFLSEMCHHGLREE